jgi:hypothetical protein
MDQRVASQHEEQQQPLEQSRHLVGDANRDLCRLAAEIGQRKNEACRDDAERIEPSQERHDDGREAVAGRNHRTELADGARHFRYTGEACQGTGDQKREIDHLLVGETGKPPCPRRLAKHRDLEPLERPPHDEPEHQRRNQRETEAPMGLSGFYDPRQNCILGKIAGFRKVEAFRIAPRAPHRPVEQELRDIDQHQACQDLVGVEPRFQKCRNRRIGGPADHPADQHQRQHQGRFPTVKHHRQDRSRHRTDDELAFRTDIPVVGTVTDRQADSDQDQRRRLDRQLMQ